MCCIPDDHIEKRRFPLFFARDVLRTLVAQLAAENAVAPDGASEGARRAAGEAPSGARPE